MSTARLLYRFDHGDRPINVDSVIDLESKNGYEAINGWVDFAGLKNVMVSRHRGVELSGSIVQRTRASFDHPWTMESQYDLVALGQHESGQIEILVYIPMAELSMTDLSGEDGVRVRFCSSYGYESP